MRQARRRRGLFGSFGRARGRARLGRFVALAVRDQVARAAFRFRLPALFEFFCEFAERRLLTGGDQLLFDRRLHLRQRLLRAGSGAENLEHVVTERRLHRAAEHVLGGGEDRFAQRLLLLARDHFLQEAAVGRAGWVDRHSLCHAREALAGFDFLLRAARLSFRLRQDDLNVALFRRAVLGLVFVVVLGDLRFGDFALLLDDLFL